MNDYLNIALPRADSAKKFTLCLNLSDTVARSCWTAEESLYSKMQKIR